MARTLTWKWSCAERQRGDDPQPEEVQISAWLVRVLEPLVVASAAPVGLGTTVTDTFL